MLYKRIVVGALLALVCVADGAAQGYTQNDLTDWVKDRVLGSARWLLLASARAEYRSAVGARFDYNRTINGGSWTVNRYGGVRVVRAGAMTNLEYWLGRDALCELSWSDPIGAIYEHGVEYGPEDLLTPAEAKANLERALREVLVPEPWSVEVVFNEALSHVYESDRGPTRFVFDYAPTYRGYAYAPGAGSRIEVDPLSGCVLSLWLNNAGFPAVDPEDVPILSPERLAALGQVARVAYANHRPLATAEFGRAVPLLRVPHFQNRPNNMTLRHRLRSELLMPILVVQTQAIGRDAQGRLTMQEFFVDPIRGVPLAVNEYPLEGWAPLGSGVPAPLRLDPAEGRWTLADGSAIRAQKVRAPRDPKDDGTVVLFDEQGRTASFRLDASRRLLWTEGPSGREAWLVSRSDAERMVRAVREATPTFATAPKSG